MLVGQEFSSHDEEFRPLVSEDATVASNENAEVVDVRVRVVVNVVVTLSEEARREFHVFVRAALRIDREDQRTIVFQDEAFDGDCCASFFDALNDGTTIYMLLRIRVPRNNEESASALGSGWLLHQGWGVPVQVIAQSRPRFNFQW